MDQKEGNALQILRDALDTEPGERDSYLSMRCGGDSALRERVNALLRGISAEESESEPGPAADPRASVAVDSALDDPLIGSACKDPDLLCDYSPCGPYGFAFRCDSAGYWSDAFGQQCGGG